MEQEKRQRALGRIYLFAAALIWGTSFVILKNTLDEVPVFFVLATRFSISAIAMLLIGIKFIKTIDRKTIMYGLLMGVCLYCAYVFQTYGLVYTTPGKNAFLTAVYCTIVPFLAWLFYKKRPDKFNFIAAAICLAGIGLVSLEGDLTVGIGDMLTLIGGFFYALHIIVISKAKNKNVFMLTMFQFVVAGVMSWVSICITGEMQSMAPLSGESWLSILYMALCCTALCFYFQTTGQKYTSPSSAAIILTLESVFGVVLSGIFYNEQFTAKIIFGFVLIFIAVIMSETKFSFLRKSKETA